MQVRFLSLFLITLVGCCCASASVRWLEEVHDFGAFSEDLGKQTAVYRFVNEGPEAVAIVSARANCGCTQPKYSPQPVAVGDTAAISVSYNPLGRPGRFQKYIRVQLSDNSEAVNLTIKGVVIANASSLGSSFPVEMGPLRLRRGAVAVGSMKKQTTRTSALEWYNSSRDTLRPKVQSSVPYITAGFAPDPLGPGEQGSLTVFLRGDQCPLYGLIDTELRIWPDSTRADSYTLPVTAVINEDFSYLSADQLREAPVAELSSSLCQFQGTESAKTLKLTNQGKSPLLIRRVYTADRGVAVECSASELQPGKSADITVRLTGADTRPFAAKISVITNDPVHAVQAIRAVAE